MLSHQSALASWLAAAVLVSANASAIEIVRTGDYDTGEPATKISLAGVDEKLLVAFRDSTGHLKVTRFAESYGTITRYGTTAGNEVVTSTAMDFGYLPGSNTMYWANVVGVSNSDSRLIVWKLSGDGPVRVDSVDLPNRMYDCDVTTVPSTKVQALIVTVCIQQYSPLPLIIVHPLTNGTIPEVDTIWSVPGPSSLSRVAYVGTGSSGLPVVLVAYESSGKLGLAAVRVTPRANGSLYLETTDTKTDEGSADQIAIGADRVGRRAQITVRKPGGSFEMTQWSLSSADKLARGASGTNGDAHGPAVGYLYGGYWGTADRNDNGDLDVDVWLPGVHQADDGGGTMQGYPALQTYYDGYEGRMYAAATTNAGNLKLIAWRVGEPFLYPIP